VAGRCGPCFWLRAESCVREGKGGMEREGWRGREGDRGECIEWEEEGLTCLTVGLPTRRDESASYVHVAPGRALQSRSLHQKG